MQTLISRLDEDRPRAPRAERLLRVGAGSVIATAIAAPTFSATELGTQVGLVLCASALLLRQLAGGHRWGRMAFQLAAGCAVAVPAMEPFTGALRLSSGALCSAVVGLALLILNHKSERLVYAWTGLALAVTVYALSCLLAALYGVWTSTPVSAYSHLSVPAAASFVALGLSVLMIRPTDGLARLAFVDPGSQFLIRMLLPPVMIVPTTLGWLQLHGLSQGLFGPELGVTLMVQSCIVIGTVIILFTARTASRFERASRILVPAIEQSSDVVIITDAKGTIEYVNNAFVQVTGYGKSEAKGASPRILKSGEMPVELYGKLWQTILAGNVFYGNMTNRRKSGELYLAEIAISPIKDACGRIQNFVAIQKDITEKRRMERMVMQSDKLAAIGQLAAGVAHELNNPLSGIMGFAQLLLEDASLSAQQREDLETILTQSKRCRAIIQNLLQFSRPKQPTWEAVRLAEITRATLQLMLYELSTSGIQVDTDLNDAAPPVRGDPGAIQQVLVNLLTNARHALEGRPQPRLSIRLEAEDGTVRLRVEDNGPGIAPDVMDKIFDPFFTTKAPGKGTGLGLAICHTIMKQHSGRIAVESTVGKGAWFTLEFPAIADAAAAAAPVVERIR